MPDLIYLLAVLACPVGMGAMMLLMMRHGRTEDDGRDREMAELRAEVQRLRADRQPPTPAAAEGSESTSQP